MLYTEMHNINMPNMFTPMIQKLLVFERKNLRRIFWPTKEYHIWRIKTNEELDKLIKHKNIVNHIKSSKTKLVWSRTKNARYQNS